MEAYSLDLRERVAFACDEGVETRAEIAERFAVSTSFIRKLLARRRGGGTLAAKPHRGGSPSAIDGGAQRTLRRLVAARPDATLAELRQGLARQTGISVSVPVVCRALQRLKLPRKKSRSTPASGTRPGCGGCVGPLRVNWPRPRRASGFTWMRQGPPPA